MALIVHQHTAVDMFDVDPAYDISSSGALYAGTIVGLNSSGYVAKAGSVGASGVQALGIAGDSIADEYKTTAYSAELIISPSGASRWTSNRVSDFYNETLASGKISVYIGSGVFYTDQYDTAISSWPLGTKVYSTSAGKFTTSTGTSARVVGYILEAPTDYPSGVPGVDSPAVDNSMSLGAFLKVQLNIG
jgi:hypothetical protein